MKAQEVMTQFPGTCGVDAPLSEAVRIMWEHRCGIVPVVDPGEGRLVGMLTDRDACMGAWTQGRALHEVPVRVSMSREVYTCRPEDDVETVLRTMRERKVRRVPVVDAEERLLGLVSLDDLARSAVQPRSSSQDRAAVAETLATLRPERTRASAA